MFIDPQLILPKLRGLFVAEYTRSILLIYNVFLYFGNYATKLQFIILFLDFFYLQSLLIDDIVQIFESLLSFLLLSSLLYLSFIIALHKGTPFLVLQGVSTTLDWFRNLCSSSYQVAFFIWCLLSKCHRLLLVNIWKLVCARLIILVSTGLALNTIISIRIWILHSFGIFSRGAEYDVFGRNDRLCGSN